MREVLYIEIPTSDIAAVRQWLQHEFRFGQKLHSVEKHVTPDGCRLRFFKDARRSATHPEPTNPKSNDRLPLELSIFTWTVQRTTYLKAFRWAEQPLPREQQILRQLVQSVRSKFPHYYPEPPKVDLTQTSIFEALAPYYPKTVKHFRAMPQGEYDLTRVYWWEQRWREGVRNPTVSKPVVIKAEGQEAKTAKNVQTSEGAPYDLIYVGGALGVVHAAIMAQLGYRVLLIERLPFGRMNREWNISRNEFQTLIDLGLFTLAEFESVIAHEYTDGFNKFFDANNPPQAKAPTLHTPLVLNVAIDAELFLKLCGEKLQRAGGEIWDETEFVQAYVYTDRVVVQTVHLPDQLDRIATGRLLIDAMGTASPIAWQLNGGRAFDSVCPTVGAVIDDGFEPGVWDSQYGDVLNSHGDISRGRQLIWELFPGRDKELTFYLFHYHQVHPENPGSLLEMYEDFFTILPEYRRCDLNKLRWKKATFGYIPGYFSIRGNDRRTGFDRVLAIGDAASLQSPLIFTGFGSLVRNLPRLTDLLDTALRHDLLQAPYLNQIRAYQSNVAVTWLFSKGMMVPTNQFLPPERVNAMLNTFFWVLGSESPQVADDFIKDRAGWIPFNRMALKAAVKNPALLLWIWEMAGLQNLLRWVGSYLTFTIMAVMGWLFGWLPDLARWAQSWLEPRNPKLWFWLLTQSYVLTYGVGNPRADFVKITGRSNSTVKLSPSPPEIRDIPPRQVEPEQ